MAFLSQSSLLDIGFKYIGKNVLISDKASIYNPENIYLDDNCRVDDFCILSAGEGGIHVGKYVHIAAYSCLIGAKQIYLSNFSGISSRVTIYSSSDDFSGAFMAHPTIPKNFRNVDEQDVFLGKHVIIASGVLVLPGAYLEDGVAIGAMSLVKQGIYREFGIYAGIPVKYIKDRIRTILEYEKLLLNMEL